MSMPPPKQSTLANLHWISCFFTAYASPSWLCNAAVISSDFISDTEAAE